MGNKRKLKNCKTSPFALASHSQALVYSNAELHKKMSIIKIQFRPVWNQQLVTYTRYRKQRSGTRDSLGDPCGI
jgi:hypothetical protein